MSARKDELELLQRIGLGVLQAVDSAGEDGAPGGVLYAAMQAHGARLSQFQTFMSTLTGRGMLVLEGDCYFMTEAGQEFKRKLEAKFSAQPQSRSSSMGM